MRETGVYTRLFAGLVSPLAFLRLNPPLMALHGLVFCFVFVGAEIVSRRDLRPTRIPQNAANKLGPLNILISQAVSSSSVAPCANARECGRLLLATGGNCKRLARQNAELEAEAPTACDDVLVSFCGSCRVAQDDGWTRARGAALCVSNPLFGPSLSPTGLAWLGRYLDHYRALGLHHAFLYTRAMRDWQATLQVNSSMPATWIDLTFPTANLWYSGQTWAINDCLSRAASQAFSWALTVDVDEVLALAQGRTLGHLLSARGPDAEVLYLQAVYRAAMPCLEGPSCTRYQTLLPPRNMATERSLDGCLRAIPNGTQLHVDTETIKCMGGHGRVLKHLVRLSSAVVATVHTAERCFASGATYAQRDCRAELVPVQEGWLQHLPGGAILGRPVIQKRMGWPEGAVGQPQRSS